MYWLDNKLGILVILNSYVALGSMEMFMVFIYHSFPEDATDLILIAEWQPANIVHTKR
jgi:hypothetical protein